MTFERLGPNLSTNPDVGIYQHNGNVNGFFYYAKWSARHYDEFGYPIRNLDYFWIVNDFGDLVPQPDHTWRGERDGQQDPDFLAYYGLTLGAHSSEVNFNWIIEAIESNTSTDTVLMDFRLVGNIVSLMERWQKIIQENDISTSNIPVSIGFMGSGKYRISFSTSQELVCYDTHEECLKFISDWVKDYHSNYPEIKDDGENLPSVCVQQW